MPTTTEPPWLNFSAGVTTPNGTTTSVIPFGFTPTAGSRLVVFVAGSVTHAAAGWTEQATPVGSAETALFDKVAAGETSITVVHNGANYAVEYAVYELPAGSVFTAVTSGSVNADTFPALPGLPGTPQLVIAALGRGIPSSAGTMTAAWGAPFVEDADLLRLKAGVGATDGVYLTVGHAINVTSASVTPTLTVTDGLNVTEGSPAPDRQRIVVAYDVVAPPPPATPADVERLANASAARTMRSLGGMLRA